MPFGWVAAGALGGSLLGGGGGGGGSTPQSGTVNDVPDWLKPDIQDVVGKSKTLAETPYEAYGGPRVAGLTDMQKQAMGTASSPEAFGKSVQGYMDPYMQNVVDVQSRKAREQGGINANTLNARAAQSGAFGGSGIALQRAAQERGLSTQLSDIQKLGSEAAYSQGVGQANKAMGQQWMMGGTEQGLNQKQMDVNYQDFLAKKNDPYQKIGFQSNIIRGLPTGSTSSTYAAAPTATQNMMGMGMGMYGLNQMGVFADGGEVKSYAKGGLSEVGGPYRGKLDDVIEEHYGKAKDKNDTHTMRGIEDEQAIRKYLQGAIDQGVGGDSGYYGQAGLSGQKGLSDMPGYSGSESSVVRAMNDPGALAGSMSSLSDEQLQQIIQHPQTKAELDAAQQELAARASEGGHGLMAAFNTLPEEDQDNVVSAAGGGILAFAGKGEQVTSSDGEDSDSAPEQGAEIATRGHPAAYNTVAKGIQALTERVVNPAKPNYMSNEDYDKLVAGEMKNYRTAAGPSPYDALKEQVAELRGQNDKALQQGKGLAWLKGAERAVRPGQTNMQAGLGALSAMGESAAQAEQAHRAAQLKFQESEISLADAQRKENIGAYTQARTSADKARAERAAAENLRATADVKALQALGTAGKALQTKGGAGGAGKGPKIAEQLAAAEIAFEKDPSEANKQTVTALRRAVSLNKTSDVGATKADLTREGRVSAENAKVQAAMKSFKYDPAYLEARQAGTDEADRVWNEELARQRQFFGTENPVPVNKNSGNNTPPPPPGYKPN